MPTKPKRPCSYPGCPNLTHGRYCDEHAKKAMQDYNRYERDPETAQRYGSSWQRVRKAYYNAHPLCEACLKNGVTRPAQHVHHILPLREGGSNDASNLMSLCLECHSRLHAQRGDRWHR